MKYITNTNRSFISGINIVEEVISNIGTVTLPSGCIVLFNGGSITNGKLIGNKSVIQANRYQIFDNIELGGTWSAEEAYPEWFGAKVDNNADCTYSINQCLKYFPCTSLGYGSYTIKSTLQMRANTSFIGANSLGKDGDRYTILKYSSDVSNKDKRVLTYSQNGYDYNNNGGIIKNIYFYCGSKFVWKGLLLNSSIRLENLKFYYLCSAVSVSNYYIDKVAIVNCEILYCFPYDGDTEYVLDLSPSAGDGYYLERIHITEPQSDAYDKSYDSVKYCGVNLVDLGGAVINSCIFNVPIRIYACQGIVFNGLHQEFTGRNVATKSNWNISACTIEGSSVIINGGYLKKSANSNFLIKPTSAQWSYAKSDVSLNHLRIYSIPQDNIMHETSKALADIIKQKRTVLSLQCVYRSNDRQAKTQHELLGINMIDENNNGLTVFNNLSYMASTQSVIDANNEVCSINAEGTMTINDFDISYTQKANGVPAETGFGNISYYYKAMPLIDPVRKIAIGGSSSKDVTDTISTGVNINVLPTGTPAYLLAIYRGVEKGNYTHRALVPVVSINNLMDTGTSVEGYKYVTEFDKKEIDIYIQVSKYRYINNGKNIVIYYHTIPSNGTWTDGDVVINTTISNNILEWRRVDGLWKSIVIG